MEPELESKCERDNLSSIKGKAFRAKLRKMDYLANAFAADILMPEKPFRYAYEKVKNSPMKVYFLSDFFGVPEAEVGIRIINLKLEELKL
jgi:Zn-dependent peptidase ImmA (M78 family)